jgi:hypothetical protein
LGSFFVNLPLPSQFDTAPQKQPELISWLKNRLSAAGAIAIRAAGGLDFDGRRGAWMCHSGPYSCIKNWTTATKRSRSMNDYDTAQDLNYLLNSGGDRIVEDR